MIRDTLRTAWRWARAEARLLPRQLQGFAEHSARVALVTNPRGISATAHGPLFTRLILHHAGLREDAAAAALAAHLPALSKESAAWIGSLGHPTRDSGLQVPWTRWPVRRPTSMSSFLAQRTELLDRWMLSSLSRVEQVVILGAGWDTRAWGLLADADARILSLIHI